MKKIIISSTFILIISFDVMSQIELGNKKHAFSLIAKQPVTNDVNSNSQKPSAAQLMTLKLISDMIAEKMPAETILIKLLPTYNSKEIIQLMLNIREMYNADFSTQVLVDALIKNYSLSIYETIQVIYIGYKYSNKERTDASAWAYAFQRIITDTYKAKNKSLQKFLKDSELAGSELDISAGNVFSYLFLYLNANASPDRNNLFFRNLANAGYSSSVIHSLCVLNYDVPELERVKHFQFWTPFFCRGMFESGVTAYLVANALNYDLKINDPILIAVYLKDAGYGPAEILLAVKNL